MELISFSVEDYRSITKAHKLPIQDLTVLIGPNNEGKSNILKALVTALRIVSQLGRTKVYKGRIRLPHRLRDDDYSWDIDFPVPLQTEKPDGESIFNLEFGLTDSEIVEFKNEVESNLSGTLPIQITIGKKEPGFRVKKRGPGANALSAKSELIALFIGKRLNCEYIPAIRTAESAQRIVENMVALELSTVEDEEAYINALKEIERIQSPILTKISQSIKGTLAEFLPAVKNVEVKISKEGRYQALRYSCEMTIDDGTPTLLYFKGDGVKSLAALGLMRHASERGARGRHLILAIEEPESHLHPNAIHQLKLVLKEISGKHQIIMTTHNPIFVDRQNISSNIVVTERQAIPAKNIKEIRDILGVRASDNLRNAELVLVVEGENDRMVLSVLLPYLSVKLKEALTNGKFAIDSLLGGNNLAYKLSQIRDALCNAYVFLDYDECGIGASEKARQEGLLLPADVTFSICEGMPESEIEDMYNSDIYKDMLWNRYGVTLDTPKFKNNKKWSNRLKDVFKQQGKQWNENVEKEVKVSVGELVASNPGSALSEHKRSVLDALVKSLEDRLIRVKPSLMHKN